MFKGKMPDITPAQIIAAVFGALFPALTLIGVDLSAEQKDALEELKWLALGLFGADAAIRVGRNVGGKAVNDDEELDEIEGEVPPDEYELIREFPEDPPQDAAPEGAVGGKFGESV